MSRETLSGVVVVSPETLTSMIKTEIDRAITELSGVVMPQKEVSDAMAVADTLAFLKENGYPTRKSALYNLVARRAIPYRKRGKYLNFSRKELLQWIESRTTESGHSEAALRIAKSAMRKK